MHVSNGSMVHQKEGSFEVPNLWLELTMCGREYVRQTHSLAMLIPSSVVRFHETTDPVNCMTCLVKMAEL